MAVTVPGSNGSDANSASRAIIGKDDKPDGASHDRHRTKVGVIGCGYWGPQLTRNLHEMPNVQLVGVADTKPERLQNIGARYPEVSRFSSHAELLESDVEAVVISTPIHTHHAIASDALRAGKHVLIEKPLAASTSEAVDLIGLGQSAGRVVMVGHTVIYNPAVQELRRLVGAGELGRS